MKVELMESACAGWLRAPGGCVGRGVLGETRRIEESFIRRRTRSLIFECIRMFGRGLFLL